MCQGTAGMRLFSTFDSSMAHLCVRVRRLLYGRGDGTVLLQVVMEFRGQSVVQAVREGGESEQQFVYQALKLFKVVHLKKKKRVDRIFFGNVVTELQQ